MNLFTQRFISCIAIMYEISFMSIMNHVSGHNGYTFHSLSIPALNAELNRTPLEFFYRIRKLRKLRTLRS